MRALALGIALFGVLLLAACNTYVDDEEGAQPAPVVNVEDREPDTTIIEEDRPDVVNVNDPEPDTVIQPIADEPDTTIVEDEPDNVVINNQQPSQPSTQDEAPTTGGAPTADQEG